MTERELNIIVDIAKTYDEVEAIAKFLDEVVDITDNEEIMALADRLNSELNL